MTDAHSLYGISNQDWKFCKLSELCLQGNGIQTGPFGSQLHQKDYVQVGTPIITVEHLGENRILHVDLPKVSEKDRKRLEKYSLQEGDIVFSRVGSVDRRALVRKSEEGWLFSGRCLRIRPDKNKIDPSFLSWFFGLPSFKEYIRSIAVGATMPSLNTKILRDLLIPVPPLAKQLEIAEILNSLDDKIELNRQMNQTLEDMARAIFKSWFVDFDPVRAKAEGRPTGLPAEIDALFPDGFEESAMGEIPRGWRVESLDESISFLNGLACQKYPPTSDEDSLPVIKIAELRKGITGRSDRATSNVDPEYIINDGDILFSWSGSLEVCIWTGGKGVLNQHLFKVTSDIYPKWFFYHWTFFHLSEFRAIAAGKATTMGHIQRSHLHDVHIFVPPDRFLSQIDNILTPHMEKILINALESRNLLQLRNLLLQKLLSER